MNSCWSTYIQESKELYSSRSLRFHEGNKNLWLKTLQIENGMKILEVGCGGGVFCHKIKKYLPNTDVTGLDFDTGHIEYAIAKSAELNLDCTFINGDASSLPFENNTFDVCFSHAVMCFCEPNSFVQEQYRVLKPNGKIVILSVINRNNGPESWVPNNDCEEKELFEKLWCKAIKNSNSNIKRYEENERHYFEYLSKYNFNNIKADAMAVVPYSPDSYNVSYEMAIEQINGERLSELCCVRKANRLAPNALTNNEYNQLIYLINKRFDNRIELYKNGVKQWDFNVNTVLAISGTK